MKRQLGILMTGAALLMLSGGIAHAVQVQLPGMDIPKYVEPLPLLEFEFINATSGPLTGVLAGLPPMNTATFPVNAEEFRSQILPSSLAWPGAPATCGVDTASSTWGYLSGVANTPGMIRPTYLGPVVISETGVAVKPTYGNNLPLGGVVQANLPIDQTLDWADPLGATGPVGCLPDPITHEYTNPVCGVIPYIGPIPIATHMHGAEVAAAFDGGPDAWFTAGNAITGPGWPGAEYNYPNNQQESTIWFHDHALGITRLNVYAGLAGLMPIIDPANPITASLPQLGNGHDIPLIIQDRTFDTNCEIFYNLASNPQPNPTVHPFWIPEFIGDTIVVNGKTWPFLDVEPRQYRFRLVNGSNARFYVLTVNESKFKPNKKDKFGKNEISKTTLPIISIATDDGYLDAAVASPNVTIGPGERYEIILDFTGVPLGSEFIMMNSARTPFPGGGKVVKNLTDQVMKFRVNVPLSAVPNTTIAVGTPLRVEPIVDLTPALTPMPPPPAAATGTIVRQLTLNEVIGPGGPLELVVNNSKFNLALPTPGCNTAACRETEIPAVGDTEIWEIINITADAHPMHTHLTSFQVLNRQVFDAAVWTAMYDGDLLANGVTPGNGPPWDYNARNSDGAIGGNPPLNPFLLGAPILPLPSEIGWKDTVISYPGEVTRIAVRWATTELPATGAGAPVVGDNTYDDFPNGGFDPTALVGGNVGYVWHCHIVDHEDNEMMRNYTVGSVRQFIQ